MMMMCTFCDLATTWKTPAQLKADKRAPAVRRRLPMHCGMVLETESFITHSALAAAAAAAVSN